MKLICENCLHSPSHHQIRKCVQSAHTHTHTHVSTPWCLCINYPILELLTLMQSTCQLLLKKSHSLLIINTVLLYSNSASEHMKATSPAIVRKCAEINLCVFTSRLEVSDEVFHTEVFKRT